ncbi:uncharacterized protein LOC120709780 [Panicum virgatum]|uniref:uncharacterized protein LOC120709780 n=1 Tax=Panicum virgatum TaxID=38727 RepID=UPI0019D4FEFE|nr:uncharacterized protein LOC120709780 [Panicum virgatum]
MFRRSAEDVLRRVLIPLVLFTGLAFRVDGGGGALPAPTPCIALPEGAVLEDDGAAAARSTGITTPPRDCVRGSSYNRNKRPPASSPSLFLGAEWEADERQDARPTHHRGQGKPAHRPVAEGLVPGAGASRWHQEGLIRRSGGSGTQAKLRQSWPTDQDHRGVRIELRAGRAADKKPKANPARTPVARQSMKLLKLGIRSHENAPKPLKQVQPGKTDDDVRSITLSTNTPHVAARKSAAAGFSFRLEQRSEKRKVVSNRLVMFDYCPFHLIEFSLLKKWQYFQYLVLVSCDEL